VVFPAVSLPGILADSNETLANLTNQTYIGFNIDPTLDVSWIGEKVTCTVRKI
jgi:hypothetical protein